MTATATVSRVPASFVYENLVDRVQLIQTEISMFTNALNNQVKSDKQKQNELKRRSLTFIDPYFNEMNIEYMAYEYMNNAIKKYKRNYIPKYLNDWIQFGTRIDNHITALSNSDIQTTVSDYANDPKFVAFGELTV